MLRDFPQDRWGKKDKEEKNEGRCLTVYLLACSCVVKAPASSGILQIKREKMK